MALTQKYGIKYPFGSDNDDNLFVDLNKSYDEMVKSRVLHVLFTPKGQRYRNPDFGTDLIKFIFNPSDEITFGAIKSEISESIGKYVPSVEFDDISIYDDDTNDNSKIIIIHYTVNKGNTKESTSVAVKI